MGPIFATSRTAEMAVKLDEQFEAALTNHGVPPGRPRRSRQ